jgi:hypothetical protein
MFASFVMGTAFIAMEIFIVGPKQLKRLGTVFIRQLSAVEGVSTGPHLRNPPPKILDTLNATFYSNMAVRVRW